MLKLSRYVLYDILRSKVVIAYTLFLMVVSVSLFQLEENNSKAILSLLNYCLDRSAPHQHDFYYNPLL